MSQHGRSRSAGSVRPPVTHRFSAPHPNSSAFSSSAHANEDWTKISDLAERRRIQNRIAQRNYRKKLKIRLDDLGQRASASPELELPAHFYGRGRRLPKVSLDRTPTSTTRYSPDRYTPSPEPTYGHCKSDHGPYLSLPDDRHLSRTQPSFSYTSYGGSDSVTGSHTQYPSVSSYSVPSPGFSSFGYGKGSHLSPGMGFDLSSSSSPNDSDTLKRGYFDHEYLQYGSYGYDFGSAEANKRHPSARSGFSSDPTVSWSYTNDFYGDFDDLEDSASGSPPDLGLWFRQPSIQSPPLFHL